MDDPAQATIQTCIVEIANAAKAEGAREVRATTGRVSPRVDGIRKTKMRVQIVYPREVKEAVIVCAIDTEGNVTIMTEEEADAFQN